MSQPYPAEIPTVEEGGNAEKRCLSGSEASVVQPDPHLSRLCERIDDPRFYLLTLINEPGTHEPATFVSGKTRVSLTVDQ